MDPSLHRGVSAPDVDTSGPRSLRIGRYELIAQLAQGGMGTVFLARIAGEAGFSRLYAVKLMHEHLASDEAFVGMFLDEARLAAGIHHTNVVSVVDLGVCERGHFVVMQYVEGCTLEQLLKRHAERPPEMIIPLVIDLLHGLHAAHTLQDADGRLLELVHRDVSPANVLVGIDGVARITDFGIAKARSRITATRPGLLKGKLSYAAPEQFTAVTPVDARTDIFSVGVLMWSALTGASLFRGETEAQTVRNVLQMTVAPPSTVGLKPPACFDELCLRALDRNPDNRFESALVMAEALREVARENSFLASSTRIGTWVQQTFEKQLAERRTLLRDVTSGTRLARVSFSSLVPWPGVSSSDGSTNPSAVSAFHLSPGASASLEPPQRVRRSWKLAVIVGLAGMLLGGAFGWWSVPARPTPGGAPSSPSAVFGSRAQPRVSKQAPTVQAPPELARQERVGKTDEDRKAAGEPKAAPGGRPEPTAPAHEPSGRSGARPAGAHRRQDGSSRTQVQSPATRPDSERPAEPPARDPSPIVEMDSNPYMRAK
jgi:serine/threonine-protein kinase